MIGKENLIFGDDYINIKNDTKNVIMHIGEKTLMLKLAELGTKNGGDILEIGFGMHLSADGVQSNPNVTSHTIIEVHPKIYKTALEWSKDKPNTNIILGDWIDILPTIDKKFDGVIHDTHLDKNVSKFLNYIKPNCKDGTIVAFFEYVGHRNPSFSGIRVVLDTDEYESLPYKDNGAFLKNSYELQYTIFDGNKFVRDYNKSIKHLI